jgi:hypothetical protein
LAQSEKFRGYQGKWSHRERRGAYGCRPPIEATGAEAGPKRQGRSHSRLRPR